MAKPRLTSSVGGDSNEHCHVVGHVVIPGLELPGTRPNWVSDDPIAFKTGENDLGGRDGEDFGTVRPRVQTRAPDQFRVQNRRFWTFFGVAGAQPGHRFVENLATRLRSLSRWSADLNSDDSDLVAAHSCISVDAANDINHTSHAAGFKQLAVIGIHAPNLLMLVASRGGRHRSARMCRGYSGLPIRGGRTQHLARGVVLALIARFSRAGVALDKPPLSRSKR